MNKLVLGIVAVLAVVVVGGFFYLQLNELPAPLQENTEFNNTSPQNNQTESIEADMSPESNTSVSLEGDTIENIIVAYSAEGFEPAAIEINQGQTVTFINQSSRGMWVGSDPHPTHTHYPEKDAADCLGSSFDSCKNIPAGASWSFTFNEVGSWGYHNHTQASHRGTIKVN